MRPLESGTAKYPPGLNNAFLFGTFNALSFQVFDPDGDRRDTLGGMVAPRLEWDFSLQAQAASEPSRA